MRGSNLPRAKPRGSLLAQYVVLNGSTMRNWFYRVVLSRPWATFVVMGLSFVVFGVTSINLFFVASANLRLIGENGWQALNDGAGRQLLELLVTVYLSMVAYVIFKTCEHNLVYWFTEPPRTPVESTKTVDKTES